MNNPSGVYRRWRRRAMTVLGLTLTTATAAAIPALAHPNFPTGAGFANTMGSTTNPYPPGTSQTLNMYLPFEQDGVTFNGADNTTVDTQVTLPADWTNPACGNVSTATDPNHVGTVLSGWTCVIETTTDGHQVLHWHGPQIGPPPLSGAVDSAQFFTFQVTAPSPATTTSYGATGSPAEGFFVQQVYADGTTELWRSPNDTTRPTATTAFGIVRTVAGTSTPTSSPSPLPSPTPSPTPTPTPTSAPTPSPTPTPTSAPTPTPRPSPTPSPGAVTTTTTLSVLQIPLPFNLGGFVIPIATVAPSNAAGKVQFFDGTTPFTGAIPVIGGTVIGPFRSLPAGRHSITAVFIPTKLANFLPSQSNTMTVRF